MIEAESYGLRGVIGHLLELNPGFSLTYEGDIHPTLGYQNDGSATAYFSSTEEPNNSLYAILRYKDINNNGIYRGGYLKTHQVSIRCIQD